jgi:hypothetical protein
MEKCLVSKEGLLSPSKNLLPISRWRLCTFNSKMIEL